MKTISVLLLLLLQSIAAAAQDHEEPSDAFGIEQIEELLGSLVPDGWNVYEGVSVFTPDNLYEQINGRATYYLSYDCEAMAFIGIEHAEDAAKYIDVSVFDMAVPVNAFGVFSAQRPDEDYRSLSLGRDAYEFGGHHYLWIGRYYVRLITSGTDEVVQDVAGEISARLAERIPDKQSPVSGLGKLPEENRVDGSERYYRTAAMGLDFLNDAYFASYEIDGRIAALFFASQETPAAAEELLNRFFAYAESYGEQAEFLRTTIGPAVLADMGDGFDYLIARDHLVIGVMGASDDGFALRATEWFAEHLDQ